MIQIKKLLNETDPSLFIAKIISRNDGLLHLLYSDVTRLLTSVANDFPEIAKVQSIGQSNEGRDIFVLELTMDKNSDSSPAATKSSGSLSASQTSDISDPPLSEMVFLDENSADWDDAPSSDDKNKFKPGSLGH